MKLKITFLVLLILTVSILGSYFIYQSSDEKLSEVAASWKVEAQLRTQGVFSQIQVIQIPKELKSFEEACEFTENSSQFKVDFLKSWDNWVLKNKLVLDNSVVSLTQSSHQFINSGMSFFIEDLERFYNLVEIFDYHICALKLKGYPSESDLLISRFAIHILAQLKNPQPAQYQLWVLQTLQIYLKEEKVLTQSLKLKESLSAQIQSLNEENLFENSKKFSSRVILNSFENLKSKGWLNLTSWLPAMLIHTNKLYNQMAQFEMGQDYVKPDAHVHWSNVSNLNAIYFTLYTNMLKKAWLSIPSELAALKSLTGP